MLFKNLNMNIMSCLKKFTKEYPIKSSIKILYEFISTPESLGEWFAEEVTIKNGIITFKWYESEIKARLLSKRENEWVRYQWLDEHEHPLQYLEIRINIEPISNDVALIITDFCKPEEVDDQISLWDISVSNLIKRIGGQ